METNTATKKLFIGGLNWATTEEDLKNAFENY
jgi:RNA recognition motif-containing protein